MSTVVAQELAELRRERDAAVAELRARTAELAQRDTDYRERAAHQSATSDVIKAMVLSPADPQPVFDLIVQRARALLDVAAVTLYECKGHQVYLSASDGGSTMFGSAAWEAYQRGWPKVPDRGSLTCRAILDGTLIHVRDMTADAGVSQVVRDLGHKTQVSIPFMRDGRAIGAIATGSPRVNGISDAQIQLLQTFAEQAVIAITSAETYRALQERTQALGRRNSEYEERIEQQTATIDVLKAMSASPGDARPVFKLIVDRARAFCEAEHATTALLHDGMLHLQAFSGMSADYVREYVSRFPRPVDLSTLFGRAILARETVQAPYVQADPALFASQIASFADFHTVVGVPMLRRGEPIGAIALGRRAPGGFTETQIELLKTFAEQAVIAISSAETYRSLLEALERQTATAEVLQVINASPGNLAPVFEAILERAHTLCGAPLGSLVLRDDEMLRAVATRGYPPEYEALARQGFSPIPPFKMLLSGEPFVHISDTAMWQRAPDEEEDPMRRAAIEITGIRTALFVPLRRDNTVLGYISAQRQEVRPFTGKQIALLQNFAAQAVIAMENARLLTEQREALEQQTATSEVLQVINASPGNLAPVFDAILEKAHTLCGAAMGSLVLFDGTHFRAAATLGYTEEYDAVVRQAQLPTIRTQALIDGGRFAHVLDMQKVESELDHSVVARSRLSSTGIRTALWMPLRKDNNFLGFISAYRRKVQAFSEKEIALLENFAAQAVIAMDNARLLTEQREALEQQTATAEVLQVINASPGNLAPVFDAMLEKAMRLCGAAFGLMSIYDGRRFHRAAERGVPEAFTEFHRRNVGSGAVYGPGTAPALLLEGANVIHNADLMAEVAYHQGEPNRRALVDLGGARSHVCVALRKDQTLLGYLAIYRQEVRPFAEKEIALLQNFAAQAVIAMENARLLNEIGQRQEELRVTFENMGDGVAMFDERQHLVAWNSKFQEIYDLPDTLLEEHRTYEEYLRFLAERGDFGAGVETAEQISELVATTGQPYCYERTRPDGRVIEIRRNLVPDGGFVLIFSDITERKRSEAEIRAARDAAEAAYRDLKAAQASLIQAEKMASLGQLTAGIAHEIKNPLNFVNNFASLSVDLLDELKQTVAPGLAVLDEARRSEVDELANTLASNLEKINEHGRRADGIVRGMLEHSRGSSGERREVELNALIDEALNLAYHGARAQDQSFAVTLQREFGEGIAPIKLAPQDVTRVLLNLLSNGFYAARERQRIESAPGFEPTLTVSTRELDRAVEIKVRDNGIGIPDEVRDRLFQPFFTTKPPGEGTGLGLSMSYDVITQQHGGSISVDSKVGEYSEFTVRLPRTS